MKSQGLEFTYIYDSSVSPILISQRETSKLKPTTLQIVLSLSQRRLSIVMFLHVELLMNLINNPILLSFIVWRILSIYDHIFLEQWLWTNPRPDVDWYRFSWYAAILSMLFRIPAMGFFGGKFSVCKLDWKKNSVYEMGRKKNSVCTLCLTKILFL